MENGVDIALRAIQEIHTLWQIDPDGAQWVGNATPEGILRDGYGFEWWPGDFKVTARVYGPNPEASETADRLNVRTDFLSGIDVTESEFLNKLSPLNRICPSFSICTVPTDVSEMAGEDPKSSDAWLASTGYVHAGIIEWFPKFFGGQAVLQIIEAQFRADAAAQQIGGRPNCLDVVRSPPDDTLDGMLGVEEESFVPEGQGSSRWSDNGEFERIIEKWGRSETTFGNADGSGLTLEVSFGNDSALLRFFADEPHPRLGSGLLSVVQLPFSLGQNEASAEANNLNFWEAQMWTKARVPFVGNWSSLEFSENQYCVAYTSFIPNLLFQPGLAENAALWGISRVRCVRETWYPDLVDVPMYEILEKRFSQNDSQ